MTYSSQRGIGLIEVMVAALILAVAVLGFMALQYRSLEAANEAYYRTQAMSMARDLAERIRANQFAQSNYVEYLTYKKSEPAPEPDDEDEGIVMPTACTHTSTCNQEQFAYVDAMEIKAKAQDVGMQIAMQTCSGVARQCIYIAWDETLPKDGDPSTEKVCTSGGTYVDASRCIVMEAYE